MQLLNNKSQKTKLSSRRLVAKVPILEKVKGKRAGVFIDDSNIYFAQKKAGWKVDWRKLKTYLSRYCKIRIFSYYAALPAKNDASYRLTTSYLSNIEKIATVKTKPLKYIKTPKAVIRKGDVDVEIVLDVVRIIKDLDVVFVVSGDSDYLELRKWVIEDKKKTIIFVAFEANMAWELRQGWHIYLNRIKQKVKKS